MSVSKEHHAAFRRQAKRDHEEQVKHHSHFAAGGHVKHEDEAEDKKLVKEMVGHAKIKLKDGGEIEGKSAKRRLDRAAGGRTGKKGASKTVVNIVMPQGGDKSPMMPPGGPMMAPHPPMPPPPMMPPPGAGGPPGMPPGMPPRPPMGGPMPPPGMPMRKRGGKVPEMDAGSGGGLGRLEKMKDYGDQPVTQEGKPAVDKGEGEDKNMTSDLEDKKLPRGMKK